MIFTSLTHSSTQQARITNLNGDIHPESNDREPLTINIVRVFAGRWKTAKPFERDSDCSGKKIKAHTRTKVGTVEFSQGLRSQNEFELLRCCFV